MSEPSPHRPVTVEDLRCLPDDLRCELVAGEIVREPPPGREHGGIALTVGAHLYAFVRLHKLGRVFGETGYVLASDPDTVRGPDASFVSSDRLASLPQRGPYLAGAPDLAVEVVSPGNSRAEIARKVREYLAAGGRLVWVIDPRAETVVVHRPTQVPTTLGREEALDGGDVVPGFRLPVAELFAAY